MMKKAVKSFLYLILVFCIIALAVGMAAYFSMKSQSTPEHLVHGRWKLFFYKYNGELQGPPWPLVIFELNEDMTGTIFNDLNGDGSFSAEESFSHEWTVIKEGVYELDLSFSKWNMHFEQNGATAFTKDGEGNTTEITLKRE